MENDSLQRELIDLAFAVCDGVASDKQIERIEQLLTGDPAARLLYLQCVEMHLDMERNASPAISSPLEQSQSQPMPLPIVIDPFPSSPIASFLPHGFLVSYGIAAAVVGIGMLIAWTCKVSIRQEVAADPSRPVPTVALPKPEIAFVGRIADMVECRWADARNAPVARERIALGREYSLASGWVEIAYDTGAKSSFKALAPIKSIPKPAAISQSAV